MANIYCEEDTIIITPFVLLLKQKLNEIPWPETDRARI
jgi:hypothetical protein